MRINLSRIMDAQKQLMVVGMLLASIHAASSGQAPSNLVDNRSQRADLSYGAGQHEGIAPDGLRRLHQTAIGIRPTTDEQDPVLDQHRQQLGIHLSKDAPRLGAAPGIDLTVTFP